MITVTSTANGVSVDTNSYYGSATSVKIGYWSRGSVKRIIHYGDYIEVKTDCGEWLLNVDGSYGLFGVGSVDGVTPVSVDDLYDKLVAIV